MPRGRKPAENPKTKTLIIRIAPEEKEEIYAFARARNMSLLDLIRRGIQAERENPTHIVIRAIKKKER